MNSKETEAYFSAITKMENMGIDACYQSLIIARLQVEIESLEQKKEEQKRSDSIKIVRGAVGVITMVCNWYHKCNNCPFYKKTNNRCELKAMFGKCTPNNWSTEVRNNFGGFDCRGLNHV